MRCSQFGCSSKYCWGFLQRNGLWGSQVPRRVCSAAFSFQQLISSSLHRILVLTTKINIKDFKTKKKQTKKLQECLFCIKADFAEIPNS